MSVQYSMAQNWARMAEIFSVANNVNCSFLRTVTKLCFQTALNNFYLVAVDEFRCDVHILEPEWILEHWPGWNGLPIHLT